jgi:hypothetical protein
MKICGKCCKSKDTKVLADCTEYEFEIAGDDGRSKPQIIPILSTAYGIPITIDRYEDLIEKLDKLEKRVSILENKE